MDMLPVVECLISKAWDCRFSIFCSNSLLKVWKAGSNPKGNSQNCSEVAGNSVLSFFLYIVQCQVYGVICAWSGKEPWCGFLCTRLWNLALRWSHLNEFSWVGL